MLSATLLFLSSVQASSDLRVPPPHEVGRRVSYEYRKERLEIVGGRSRPRPTGYSRVEIELLSKDEEGLVLAWTLGAAHMDDPDLERLWLDTPGIRAVQEATEGLRIEFELDPAGPPRKVRNEREVKPRLRALLLASERAEHLRGGTEIDEDEVLEKIDGSLESPEFAQVYLKDLQLFLLGRGMDLPRQGVLETDGQVPNMFGGPPIPAAARFWIEEIADSESRVTLRFELAPDPAEYRQVLFTTLKPLTAGSRNPVRTLEDVPEMDIRDVATVVVDLRDGWTESVTWQRTVSFAGKATVEKRSFRRISAEK